MGTRTVGTVALGAFAFELRFALRRLVGSPGFSAAAALSLALGIGANAIVFTFVNRVFFTPLPIRNQSELVSVVTIFENGRTVNLLSYPNS